MSGNDVVTKGRKVNRYIMYVNQLDRMTLTFDELYDELIKYYPVGSDTEFAMIIHDKDKDNDGNVLKPHVHVSMYSREGFTRSWLTKLFHDDNFNNFEYMRNKDAEFLYLTHRTTNAMRQGKFLYDVSDVKANFNYEDYVMKKLGPEDRINLSFIMDEIVDGHISKSDIFRSNTLSKLYAKNRRRFEDALYSREQMVKESRKDKVNENLS